MHLASLSIPGLSHPPVASPPPLPSLIHLATKPLVPVSPHSLQQFICRALAPSLFCFRVCPGLCSRVHFSLNVVDFFYLRRPVSMEILPVFRLHFSRGRQDGNPAACRRLARGKFRRVNKASRGGFWQNVDVDVLGSVASAVVRLGRDWIPFGWEMTTTTKSTSLQRLCRHSPFLISFSFFPYFIQSPILSTNTYAGLLSFFGTA